jgi:large subunit ribosomal protein L25
MHEKSPVLKASKRDRLGSRVAQRERALGHLPAVIYGHGRPPVAVNFPSKETITLIEKGEKVFRLEMEGESGQVMLLKDVQFDYLGDSIIHADFARVDLNERVKTKVHIALRGDAIGLKQAGAILMHPTNEIIIECRVADLPESIQIDISGLELNGLITADKVPLPSADMKLLTDPHAIIAQIVEAKEEVAAEATAVAAGGVAPEVIGEKEKAEKAAADAKPGAKPAAGAAPAKDAKAAAPKK